MDQKDYEEFAAGLDDMRELLRAAVAGLVKDGFTDREARTIVTGIWAQSAKGQP